MPLPKEVVDYLEQNGKAAEVRSYAERERSFGYSVNPAPHIYDVYLASTIDTGRFDEEKEYKGNDALIAQLAKAKEDAAKITVPIPDGFDATDLQSIILSAWTKKEYIASSYVDSLGNAGSSLPDNYDRFGGGITNFTQNFVDQDSRANMWTALLYLPKARQDACDMVEEYNKGNVKPMFDALMFAFKTYYESSKSLASKTDAKAIFTSMNTTRLFDMLNRPEFSEYAHFTEEERIYTAYLKKEQVFVHDNLKLGEELHRECLLKQVPPHSEDKIADDPDFNKKLMTYLGGKRYLKTLAQYMRSTRNRFSVLSPTFEEVDSMMCQREMFDVEKLFLANSESYLKDLEGVVREKLPDTSSMTYAQALDELVTKEYLNALDVDGNTMIDQSDKILVVEKIKRELKEAETHLEKYGMKPQTEIYKKLLSSKLFTNPPLEYNPSMEQIDARMKDYEDFLAILATCPTIYDHDGVEPFDLSRSIMTYAQTGITQLKEAKVYLPQMSEFRSRALGIPETYAKIIEGKSPEWIREYNEKQFEEVNRIIAAESKEPVLKEEDLEFGLPTREAATRMLTEQLDVLLNIAGSNQDLRGLQANLTSLKNAFINGETGSLEFSKLTEDLMDSLSEKHTTLTEQMLDDDSPELQQALTAVGRLMEQIELYNEASKINPDSPEYSSAYNRLEELGTEMADTLKAKETAFMEKEAGSGKSIFGDQDYLLASAAQDSIENIKTAIRNEVTGNIPDGISSISKKDLVSIALFQFSTLPGSPVGSIVEKKGAEQYIEALSQSKEVMTNLEHVNIESLHTMLEQPNGFTVLLHPEHKVMDKGPDAAQKVQAGPEVKQAQGPVSGI